MGFYANQYSTLYQSARKHAWLFTADHIRAWSQSVVNAAVASPSMNQTNGNDFHLTSYVMPFHAPEAVGGAPDVLCRHCYYCAQ